MPAPRYQSVSDIPRATRRQHRRPRVDLRADRVRLCADLSRQPRAQSRAWRADDARRLYGAGDRVALQRPSGHRAGRSHPPEPAGRRAGLCLSDAQDDRRDGACRDPHDRRARHSDPRPGGADLVGAAAISGAGARRAEPVAGAVRRRAHFDVVRRAGRDDGPRLRGAVCLPALRPLGHAHARRRAEPAAGGAARHQPARRLCAGLEPVDAHRRARRHFDGARFRR